MQVGKPVVIGVGVAFVAMIAAICFLLGRESAHHGRVISTTSRETPSEAPRELATAPEAPPPPSVVPSSPAIPSSAPAVRAESQQDSTAVRDYFIVMDGIQAFTGESDVGAYSNTLLAGAMNGDMSGFDHVLELAKDGAAKARAISPPAACRAYHDKMLALLSDGIDMLRRLIDAMKTKDPSALGDLASSGNALKARVQSGPTCTQILAYFGADVIKVEKPGEGDPTRGQLRDVPGEDSLYFTMLNGSKRAITLNPKSRAGKEIFAKLIQKCDVMVENFAPGAIDRMGFPWEKIQQLNPRMIYASIRKLRPVRRLQGLRKCGAMHRRRGVHHRRN